MAYRAVGYQYDTSPKKIKPEYDTKEKKYSKKKQTSSREKDLEKKKRQTQRELEIKKTSIQTENTKKKAKSSLKSHTKTLLYILAGFTILFAISYRNSLITENFKKKETLKKQLEVLQKENAQLEIAIQSSLNLANVQKNASELLGMQKIDESQKVYVTLPKKDYVEPATEQMTVEQTKRWYEKLIDSIINIIP